MPEMHNLPDKADVVIVGAGLAGLACARALHAAGREPLILEASDGVGGRVRSDLVEGFVLDRGFQVLLTAYPEAQRVLDYGALDLKAFTPGALVQIGKDRHRVVDPWRAPSNIISTARAPIGSMSDKMRLAALRRAVGKSTLDELWARPETSTELRFEELNFSPTAVERFLGPLFAGISLDPDLGASSRVFEFVYRMLAEGDSAIPARGMQAIPDQLAAGLPAGSIRLLTPVTEVAADGTSVVAGNGTWTHTVRAEAVVVATDSPRAARLLNDATVDPGSQSAMCIYYSAPETPLTEPILVLNGNGRSSGPVNNVCVPSSLSPALAPVGSHLVSATVLGDFDEFGLDEAAQRVVEVAARKQLRTWFGSPVDRWQPLRTYRIEHAQPSQKHVAPKPVTVRDHLFVAGDHRESASINGALLSGSRAAEAILSAS